MHGNQQQACIIRLSRVLYFTFSVLARECLFLAMIQGPELASTALACIAAAAIFLIIPFSDSMSPAVVGPRLLQLVRTP